MIPHCRGVMDNGDFEFVPTALDDEWYFTGYLLIYFSYIERTNRPTRKFELRFPEYILRVRYSFFLFDSSIALLFDDWFELQGSWTPRLN